MSCSVSKKDAAITAYMDAYDAARSARKAVERAPTQALIDAWHEACSRRDHLECEARTMGQPMKTWSGSASRAGKPALEPSGAWASIPLPSATSAVVADEHPL